MKRFVLLGLLLLLVSAAVMAQGGQVDGPNDPKVNERANACYAGGSMEGKCAPDSDGDGIVEDFEYEWAWECGWYLIRAQAGFWSINNLPERCGQLTVGTCYASDTGASLIYTGASGQIGNTIFYSTPDCTGTGNVYSNGFILSASNPGEAAAICEGVYGVHAIIVHLSTVGWNISSDLYSCEMMGPRGILGGYSLR